MEHPEISDLAPIFFNNN